MPSPLAEPPAPFAAGPRRRRIFVLVCFGSLIVFRLVASQTVGAAASLARAAGWSCLLAMLLMFLMDAGRMLPGGFLPRVQGKPRTDAES